MIEALLHRKLPFKLENMEDILTSNVFGMLQYVPPEDGLFLFLAQARTAETEGEHQYPLQNLSGGPDAVEYLFWPEWQVCEPVGTRRIQPDVVLNIKSVDGVSCLVAIEAKYRSGKSSEAEEADQEAEEEFSAGVPSSGKEAEETDEEAEEKVSSECTDQLVREWIALVDEATNWNAKPILIYLTADFGCPREQIRASLDEHRKKRPNAMEPLICWLSWRELADLFDKAADYPILLAIAQMAEKVGLTFFRSITKVAPICVTWRFKAPPQQWRFQVPPIMFQWSFQTSYVRTLPQTWQFRVEPIISLWRFRQTTSEWSFRVSRIVCQWRFQESAAAWYFDAAPIVLRWRFKR